MADETDKCASLEIRREATDLLLLFGGNWLLCHPRPSFQLFEDALTVETGILALRFDVLQLEEWDTALLLFVRRCCVLAQSQGLNLSAGLDDLPEGARNMIELSVKGSGQVFEGEPRKSDVMTVMGTSAISIYHGVEQYCSFMGDLFVEFGALLTGRIQLQIKEFLYLLQRTGPQALGIVCLLSFLTGLIIAFIGVIQLQKFAADIYVADLVGVAMTRELGAVMAGVIMAGRTGAAFAAQIGSMQVNEEIDALTCFGISPIRLLVLPRVLALVLILPLLCVCADVAAIFGGMVVAVSISDVSVIQYLNQVEQSVALNDLFGGLFKSVVFGLIIALSGCYRGLNCGKDAASVGLAATSAVVTAITWMVVADAVFAVTFHILGI
jgi:phospholipid/cholesterol/gamma-HCH transport system permease protein